MVNLTYRPEWPTPLTDAARQNPNQKFPEALQINTIQKQDFQNFMKHMRKSFKTRYLVAGEHGLKGTKRSHFHVILFGKGQPPTWELNKNTHIDQWPWGHVYCDNNVSEASIRYAAKYLLKGAKRKKTPHDTTHNREWISYSRIPIMGLEFIQDLAARYAAEKIYPHSFKYRPPFASERREYQLQGEACNVLLDNLYELWPEAVHVRKNERMEKAHLRYVKDRQRRRFEALSSEERNKILDREIRSGSQLNKRDLRLYGRFLWELTEYGTLSIEHVKATRPEEFAEIERQYRRDLVVKPPSYAESGLIFSARSGEGRG